jgi:hypothetical protein
MLIRYGKPSKYDHAPYGTPCKVVNALSDDFTLYLQVSDNEENPVWHEIGIFSQYDEHVQDKIKEVISNNVP